MSSRYDGTCVKSGLCMKTKATLTLSKEKCVVTKSHTAYSLWINDLALGWS